MGTVKRIAIERAREAVQRLINSHFNNPNPARCHIPADPENDDDIVASRFVEQSAALEQRIEVVKRANSVLFLSHCLNAGHSKTQLCPVCVEARAALAETERN
jgi:hypothetical protein